MSHTISDILLNHCLTIRTTCPSEALTVCIGLFELMSNWFVELGLIVLGETGLAVMSSFDFGKIIRKLEADSSVRPLHLKYRKCTIFLIGSSPPVTLTNTIGPSRTVRALAQKEPYLTH